MSWDGLLVAYSNRCVTKPTLMGLLGALPKRMGKGLIAIP